MNSYETIIIRFFIVLVFAILYGNKVVQCIFSRFNKGARKARMPEYILELKMMHFTIGILQVF